MIEINGVVEKIIYRNEDNGYTVALFNSEDESLTVVGNCIELKTSMEYELKGDFIHHNKYGEQFQFKEVIEILPQSEKGIIKYLSSGIIPYIGEKTAEKIVDSFKEDTLKIIEENPERLLEIEGIGPQKFEKIKAALSENKELREIMIFLNGYDLGTNLAIKIYKQYDAMAIDVIKENPYRLAEDIKGIGFKKADSIARAMGFDENSKERRRAALKYSLSMAAGEGHSFLPEEVLIKRTLKLINSTERELKEEITQLALDDRFILERDEEQINCYYAPYLRAENYIAGKIREIVDYKFAVPFDIGEALSKIEAKQNFKFARNQVEAVIEAVKNGILIITGGPGTGKTTTLKAIIEIFELMEKKVFLAAPTGRAAKRMKEATSREASTIHKLLDIGFSNDESINYGYEEDNFIDCDVLIVDEVSMVDLMLMSTLLRSLKAGTRLILVGDKDQLPSVGAGNVLADLIESEKIQVVNLNEVFRQSEKSMIIENAHLINRGLPPKITNNREFFLINESDERKTLETITELVKDRLPNYYGISSGEIQVLSPMRKGIVGVNNLNRTLQRVLNARGKEIVSGEDVLRVGDKVMQTKNNYNLEYSIESDFYAEDGKGVFNGDIGYISEIDEDDKTVTVLYDEIKKVKYEYADIDDLALAYASTIHKSQGSEFPVVIIPLHYGPYILLTRNLIYTAITRAKLAVVLVGEYKYLEVMIKNNRISKRYSNLRKKLVENVK
ncbi:ATP-dependent RecD-like DNA helicase [Anaerosphaera multitolerans]|uniref:ATP-dependent RecD2 DNA helicase n=1 Tax=Anaerosphaera multitolerans TaxID=2487351 RepID=A0A437S9P8_9FIRM|nr:ATP-dependent RecD-like DNA helicase [Anaerosphaera multitolerans]RVU55601.1 ATP-dependent RecD-like DNA helicase [Anaerosphaera multitolerans]